MKLNKLLALSLTLSVALLSGCEQSNGVKQSKIMQNEASITCYSGGTVIFASEKVSGVESHYQLRGIRFLDLTDNKLKQTTGDCIITFNN